MSGIKERKTYSDALKKQIADEYMRGELNMSALQKKYRIASFASIHTWVHKYGSGDVNSVRGFYKVDKTKESKPSARTAYRKKLYEKFVQGIEREVMPEFDNEQERTAYILFENLYLKKKLLDMGESKDFIANLWSSKNMADIWEHLGLADVLE